MSKPQRSRVLRKFGTNSSKQTTTAITSNFSDDESEELPAVRVNVRKSRNNGEPQQATRTTTGSVNYACRGIAGTSNASAALATLFQKHKEDKERCAQSEELRQQLEQLQSKNKLCDTSDASTIGDLSLEDLFLKKSTIKDCHKGEPLLDPSRQCCLFTAQMLDLKTYPSKDNNTVDCFLRNSTANELLMFIRTGGLKLHFGRVTHKEEVIRYVFRLLTVDTDMQTTRICRELLSEAFHKHPDIASCINLHEIIKSVINLGVDLAQLFPDSDLRSYVDSIIHNDKSIVTVPMCVSFTENHLVLLVENLVNVLRSSVRKSHVWNDKNLTCLLVMLCSLALDVNFITSPIVVDIQMCISHVITLFGETQWPQTVTALSRQICAISNDHHNLVFLVNLFFNSGQHTERLKKVTAFCAIHKILNKELPIAHNQLTDVSPKYVVNFLNGCTLRQEADLYLWLNILNLVNWCVTNNRRSISAKSLQDLCDAMKRLISTLKDDARCLDDKKVKDVAMRIEIKWSLLKNTTPYSQKTMFGYLKPKNSNTESQSSESNID